jgi:hypothetical protein
MEKKIRRSGIEMDTVCPMCSRLDEDGGHLFLHCKQVKKLWCLFDMEEARRLTLCLCANAQDMLMKIFQMGEQQKLLIIAMLW